MNAAGTSTPAPALSLNDIISAALRGQVDAAMGKALYLMGSDAVIAFSLAISHAHSAVPADTQAHGPNTPSGSVPVYLKPQANGKHRKTPGAKAGHKGVRRPTPQPNVTIRVPDLLACAKCGEALAPSSSTRDRIVEDMPEAGGLVVAKIEIPQQYCAKCRENVEPKYPEAMPNASIGNRLAIYTVWLHYGLGVTIANIINILGGTMNGLISAGGLVNIWFRLGSIFRPWYEQIAEDCRSTGVLNADETGWRVMGKTLWLWCFCDKTSVYYMIDESRGPPALNKFFTRAFNGVLIHDFWKAYSKLTVEHHQYCIPHVLRELHHLDNKESSAAWASFSKTLRRLLHDALRLRAKRFGKATHERRAQLIAKRLQDLAERTYADPGAHKDAKRMAKRFRVHWESMFTFLFHDDVPSDNNHAERMIRPAVIIRKNTYGNRSDQGAETQAVMMSIFRTLKLRGHNPLQTLQVALRTFIQTGTLPPLPPPVPETAE